MSETGVIKFTCEHDAVELPAFPGFAELQRAREQLRVLGMLGVAENGIGFGNVSIRAAASDGTFYITGSGTGGRVELRRTDCAQVTAWSCERNWLRCTGATIASAESLTHAAVYAAAPAARMVLHGHNPQVWARLLERGVTTSREVDYGTPAMALEVERVLQETGRPRAGIFAMGGHTDGFIAFGPDREAALALLRAV